MCTLELGKSLCILLYVCRAERPLVGHQPSEKRAMECVIGPVNERPEEETQGASGSEGR